MYNALVEEAWFRGVMLNATRQHSASASAATIPSVGQWSGWRLRMVFVASGRCTSLGRWELTSSGGRLELGMIGTIALGGLMGVWLAWKQIAHNAAHHSSGFDSRPDASCLLRRNSSIWRFPFGHSRILDDVCVPTVPCRSDLSSSSLAAVWRDADGLSYSYSRRLDSRVLDLSTTTGTLTNKFYNKSNSCISNFPQTITQRIRTRA